MNPPKGFFKICVILIILACAALLIVLKDLLNPILKEYQLIFELILLLATLTTLFYLIRSISIAKKTLNSNAETLDIIRKEYRYRYSELRLTYIRYDLKPGGGKDPEISVDFSNPSLTDNRVDVIAIGFDLPDAMGEMRYFTRDKEGIIPAALTSLCMTYHCKENCDGLIAVKDAHISFRDVRGVTYIAKIMFNARQGNIQGIGLRTLAMP